MASIFPPQKELNYSRRDFNKRFQKPSIQKELGHPQAKHKNYLEDGSELFLQIGKSHSPGTVFGTGSDEPLGPSQGMP